MRPFREADRSQSLSLETSSSLSRSLLRGLLGEEVRNNRARLEVVLGPAKGSVFPIDETLQRLTIGGDGNCQFDVGEPSLRTHPILILLDGHNYNLIPPPGSALARRSPIRPTCPATADGR